MNIDNNFYIEAYDPQALHNKMENMKNKDE